MNYLSDCWCMDSLVCFCSTKKDDDDDKGKKDLFEQLYPPFTEIYWTKSFIVHFCEPTIIVVASPSSLSLSFSYGLDEKIVFRHSNRGQPCPEEAEEGALGRISWTIVHGWHSKLWQQFMTFESSFQYTNHEHYRTHRREEIAKMM